MITVLKANDDVERMKNLKNHTEKELEIKDLGALKIFPAIEEH